LLPLYGHEIDNELEIPWPSNLNPEKKTIEEFALPKLTLPSLVTNMCNVLSKYKILSQEITNYKKKDHAVLAQQNLIEASLTIIPSMCLNLKEKPWE